MKFSVIIPIYNAQSTIEKTLDALHGLEYDDWELILINNNSKDASEKIIKEFFKKKPFKVPVSYLIETKQGASAARNKGASAAKGEWLVFTDADCEPDKLWLKEFNEAIARFPELQAFAGNILPGKVHNIVSKCLSLYTLPQNLSEKTHSCYTLIEGGFPTANFAIKKELFLKIGGFDETIKIYGEDHLFCIKIYESGGRICQLRSAKIRHNHRSTLKGLIKQSYGFGLSHPLLMSKMPDGFVILQLPFKTIHIKAIGTKIWIDLNNADKKALVLLLLTLFNVWLGVFLLLYLIYLSVRIVRMGKKRNVPVALYEAPLVAAALILKSFSLTCGRVKGSLSQKVIAF
jgi:glycosyltransferase involved in cell wall biosynthesis